ncbi:lipid-A-disaccharide synthase [Limibaculum sp. M0105]|uniref:Lipid-A-disaccharide synthase n=1 Tax=Thermohalobaculum xanthum TaxID=2753746 RepID=A0A8J7M673_9RHOB|nr:lipid-A-disaccharide synthase [Thermohalobaculum xanthum]MBK0398823.1 lipid-A-disaccharide synthase [Thermohalobaculum xanthum]
MSGPLVYLVTGEPSGDRLGAALMHALKAQRPDVRFAGIGGREMQAAGLVSLFDISELSVMGITEVLPRLPSILRRLREVTDDVLARRPDVLVTVDSPSFSLRVAKRVRAANPAIPTVHYVAPSVWAWRPGRAAKMARHVDHVLALLPFEPPYMEAAGMTCDFVGHPIAERAPVTAADLAAFRQRHGIAADAPLLLVAPGSRRGEVSRLMPLFVDSVRLLVPAHPGLRIVVPVAETVATEVTAGFGDLAPVFVTPEMGEAEKRAAFAAADAALVASGTVTLEMAAGGTPHVAAYKAAPLTAMIVRRLLRIETANLVNLASGTRAVPEFYQEAATPEALAAAVSPLLSDTPERAAQLAAADAALSALGRGAEAPSIRAARSVLRVLDRAAQGSG